MNLLLLAIACRAWTGSALSVFLRVMTAIAVFSIEMQLATWLHVGTLGSVRLVNVLAATLSVLGLAWRRSRVSRADQPDVPHVEQPRPPGVGRLPPAPAVALVGLAVGVLAMMRPVMGADPYHLHRVDRITSTGTLAYEPAALDIKVNALAGVYELLLADLRIPGMSTALVRLHGVLGLALYLLAIAVAASWVRVRRRWLLTTFLVIPVVFHQLVLVKNDLFGAMPAFVALAWVVTRGREMSLAEVAGAAALAGFTVGIKISSAPVPLVVAGFVLFDHCRNWRALVTTLGAGALGAVAGGLLFTLLENQRLYGDAMQPYVSLGNRNETAGAALTGVGRFTLSLFDLGLLTRQIWPGRGGWGSTFGLPLAWALVVLGLFWRTEPARRALIAAAACFVVFAASYPDADLAHRMVIGPGLLLLVVAVGCADGDDRRAGVMRSVLIPVLVLSSVQIGHSAVLYLTQR